MHTINISRQKNMAPTPHSCKSSMNATRQINHKNNAMVVKIPIMIALSILFITLPYFNNSNNLSAFRFDTEALDVPALSERE